jgi:hypothetical protein
MGGIKRKVLGKTMVCVLHKIFPYFKHDTEHIIEGTLNGRNENRLLGI